VTWAQCQSRWLLTPSRKNCGRALTIQTSLAIRRPAPRHGGPQHFPRCVSTNLARFEGCLPANRATSSRPQGTSCGPVVVTTSRRELQPSNRATARPQKRADRDTEHRNTNGTLSTALPPVRAYLSFNQYSPASHRACVRLQGSRTHRALAFPRRRNGPATARTGRAHSAQQPDRPPPTHKCKPRPPLPGRRGRPAQSSSSSPCSRSDSHSIRLNPPCATSASEQCTSLSFGHRPESRNHGQTWHADN
jgi:hypothetical protein